MWHNLTNHPAHQQKAEPSNTATPPNAPPPADADGSKKDQEEPKKASGSGSG